MKLKRMLVAALCGTMAMVMTLPAPGTAQTTQTPPATAADGAAPPAEGEVQPRFLWGFLINVVVSRLGGLVWDIFSTWLSQRITGGLDMATDRLTSNLFGNSGARVRPRASGAVEARAADIVTGNPAAPISVNDGRENYQGAHVAILVANADGKTFTARPISEGFRTGERFKIRILSTFGGELVLENINPRGERRQIYPAGRDDVVVLQPGRDTLVPLGENQFLEFTRATGREQLVVNLADPRAVGAQASRANVYRQDTRLGSNFLQQVTPTTYPHISQAIELQHRAN